MSAQEQIRLCFSIVLAIIGILTVHVNGVESNMTMITPYVNESDITSINEAFSVDECAPWGFEHGGVDFFPNGNLKPFRAVFSGTVERINLFLNQGNSYWQVNVMIRYDSTYSVEYAFEPFSSDESDGEIQLAKIAVSEGQNVSQGNIIGYLYTVGDGAHVHFGMHKNGEFACPELYFTPSARDSILNILHQIWPYAKMCYNQETFIPIAAITVDGDVADWGGIDAVAGDRQGDDSPSYMGDDIQALYLARDTTNLYLRMDLWEHVNPSFGNGPSPDEGRYSFHLQNDGPYQYLYLSVAYDDDTSSWSLGYNGSNGTDAPPELRGPEFVGVNGGVIEVKVPLSSIGSPTTFSYVRGEVLNCCVPNFQVLDETHCVSILTTTTTIIPPQGGTALSPDGSASVFFPPDAIPQAVFVSIIQIEDTSIPPPNGGFQLLGEVYAFSAFDASGNPFTVFDEMLTLSMSYDPNDLDGLDEHRLTIQYYDELLTRWVPLLPSIIDTMNHTVITETEHFSLFGIFGIVVPEPTTLVLFGLGLLGIFAFARRRVKK